MFQFTRPQGARHAEAYNRGKSSEFQFTRPQGARQDVPSVTVNGVVSIHAPARGATVPHGGFDHRGKFQFTRPQGARPVLMCTHFTVKSFNSRARKGRDRAVSPQRQVCEGFNSRARKGRDRGHCIMCRTRQSFNSRARKGRDSTPTDPTRPGSVSIHAPARGATRMALMVDAVAEVSIHAPARGATLWRRVRIGAGPVSIHAPARGATIKSKRLARYQAVSIHAPARGATLVLSQVMFPRGFQFTRPQGARPSLLAMSPVTQSFNSRARKGRDIYYFG